MQRVRLCELDRGTTLSCIARLLCVQKRNLFVTIHQHQSVYREQLLEHLLIGQLLRHAWLHDDAALEVAKPEIDRAGYDIVLEAHGIVRHVQLKTSSLKARTARQNIHLDLATKPGGCIIWTRFDEKTLDLGPFLFFGGSPGSPLPSLEQFGIARHTRGNATGYKAERVNIRVVPKGQFRQLDSIDVLYRELFGE